MTSAARAEGPWEPAHLVKPARGLIDACALWDDDGRMYVVHAWAKSRAGFNAVLRPRGPRRSPDRLGPLRLVPRREGRAPLILGDPA